MEKMGGKIIRPFLAYLLIIKTIQTDYDNPRLDENLIYTRKTRTKDKYRVVYTDHQRVELEKEFYYSRYITIRRKAELANNLGLSERQVKIWFQNRRAKERKQVKKRDELSHNHQSGNKDNNVIINNMTQQMIMNQQQQQQQPQENRMLHIVNDTELIGQNNLTRLV